MEQLIKKLIDSSPEQAITYEQFMSHALYHPDQGYYMTEKRKVGKEGDFYTSPHVHPVFSRVVARVLFNKINQENLPPVICEFGGGDARFALIVMEEWKRLSEPGDPPLTYIVVESGPLICEQQNKCDYIFQYKSFEQLQADYPGFEGVIFSNELLDALPVRVVEMHMGQLYEVFICVNKNGQLAETKRVCTDSEIMEWMDSYGIPLMEGQRFEVPLAMTRWIRKTADWLKRGMMYTIDYGYTSDEWQSVARKDGSLRGYYQHEMVNNPLLYPGEMDLTTHIHLDAVEQTGAEHGLTHVKTIQQSKFLLEAGILDELIDHQDPDPFSEASKQNRAIRSLVMDGAISSYFQVIIQSKL